MVKRILLVILCLLCVYSGYWYSYVIERPKVIGSVLFLDGWMKTKVIPTIPIIGFNFYRTSRINDYFILEKADEYLLSYCESRLNNKPALK